MVNLLDLSRSKLEQYVLDCGEPKFRARQLGQWIHQRGVIDFDAMTDISKDFRQRLKATATIEVPRIIQEQLATDGTCKWLLRLDDGNAIETVYIPDKTRGTLCISSQVGCALNCSFCATGKEGFNRNLSVAEIIGQLWVAVQRFKVTNVVMMGMGEPLLNYDPVVAALDWMLSDHGYGLSKYRVTVSTSGVLPQMARLKKDLPVSLAVSLHAATNDLRDQLVPLNKKYPLEKLIAACRDYFPKEGKQSIMFEYVMLAGVNDSLQHAKALTRLLNGFSCKINLIPFNPFAGTFYQTSTDEVIEAFHGHLVNSGFNTRVRRTRGEDVAAACGQLAGDFDDRTGRHKRWLKTGKLVPLSGSRE
jgi:23S rRNA (adenine2503-C2)-methyltransferase